MIKNCRLDVLYSIIHYNAIEPVLFQELTNIKLILFFLLRVFFLFLFFLWSLRFISLFLLSLLCLLFFFYHNRNSSLVRVVSTIIYNKCKIVLSRVILIRSIGYCVSRWVHIP